MRVSMKHKIHFKRVESGLFSKLFSRCIHKQFQIFQALYSLPFPSIELVLFLKFKTHCDDLEGRFSCEYSSPHLYVPMCTYFLLFKGFFSSQQSKRVGRTVFHPCQQNIILFFYAIVVTRYICMQYYRVNQYKRCIIVKVAQLCYDLKQVHK